MDLTNTVLTTSSRERLRLRVKCRSARKPSRSATTWWATIASTSPRHRCFFSSADLQCLIFSLYSIAKQPGEPYCLVALEMMTAIASKNPRLCAETGSIQVRLLRSLLLRIFTDRFCSTHCTHRHSRNYISQLHKCFFRCWIHLCSAKPSFPISIFRCCSPL